MSFTRFCVIYKFILRRELKKVISYTKQKKEVTFELVAEGIQFRGSIPDNGIKLFYNIQKEDIYVYIFYYCI